MAQETDSSFRRFNGWYISKRCFECTTSI